MPIEFKPAHVYYPSYPTKARVLKVDIESLESLVKYLNDGNLGEDELNHLFAEKKKIHVTPYTGPVRVEIFAPSDRLLSIYTGLIDSLSRDFKKKRIKEEVLYFNGRLMNSPPKGNTHSLRVYGINLWRTLPE